MTTTKEYGPANPAPPKRRLKADAYFCSYCGEERETREIGDEEWFTCPERCEDEDVRKRMAATSPEPAA